MQGAFNLASLISPLAFGAPVPGNAVLMEEDKSDLLFYGLVIVGMILGAFVIQFIAKISAGKRVRGITDVSVTLDDLERMRRTGLIDEEEYKNARRIVSENVVEAMMPTVTQPAEVTLQLALQELEDEGKSPPDSASGESDSPISAQSPSPAAQPPVPSPPPPGPKQQAPGKVDDGKQLAEEAWANFQMASDPPKAAKKKLKKGGGAPMDLEKLRASGAIDKAEYERLRAYYAKRLGGA